MSTCPCGRSPDPGIRPGGGCYCAPLPDETSRYTGVDVAERVRLLMANEHVAEFDEVTYSWDRGYEILSVKRHGAGSSEYRGVYHPGDGCCAGNPCHFCGMVWHD